MKRIAVIILLLISCLSFANTLTFMGNHATVPMKLQGDWTQVAFSRNSGATWIDGISVPIKITGKGLKIRDYPSEVILTSEYIDNRGRSGFVLQLSGAPELYEFWFIDEDNIVLIVHQNYKEIMRGNLIR